MADKNDYNTTFESLFKGMDNFLTTKTVVGDAMKFDDGTIVLPLVDVSFGVAAGAFAEETKKNNGAGGMGGKITPSSVLVIQNGVAKLVNVKNQDGLTKILDMVPDFINKFTKEGKASGEKKEGKKAQKEEDVADTTADVIDE